jgi:hypothetical protein
VREDPPAQHGEPHAPADEAGQQQCAGLLPRRRPVDEGVEEGQHGRAVEGVEGEGEHVLQVPLPGVAGTSGEGDAAVELGVPDRGERDRDQVRHLRAELVAQQEEQHGLEAGGHHAGHDVPRGVRAELVVAVRVGGEQPVFRCAPGGGHDPNLPRVHKLVNVLNPVIPMTRRGFAAPAAGVGHRRRHFPTRQEGQ